jgi:hypothetical protein
MHAQIYPSPLRSELSSTHTSRHTTDTHEHTNSLFLSSQISEVCLGEASSNGRLVLLKTFVALLSTVHGNTLLLNEAVLRPLKMLIDNLALPTAALNDEETSLFTMLLNALCKRIADENSLLPLFFNPKNGIASDAFPIFNALIPLGLRPSENSLLARNAIVHCCELTLTQPALARFVARDSQFCPQLTETLVTMYSALPTVLSEGKKFWKLALSEAKSLRGVKAFLDLLEFCNDIVPVSAPVVATKIINIIEEKLLAGAVAENFKAAEPSTACVAATTYVDLALRHLTAAAQVEPLVRPFVRFALQHRAVLIERIHTSSDPCLVSLRFLQTLVSLNCEDIMLELCLRPLLSREHLAEPSAPATPLPDEQPEIAATKLAFAQVQSAVNAAGPRAFLSLAPLKGAAASLDGIGGYIHDAQRTVHECRLSCAGWAHRYSEADCERAEARPYTGISSEGFYRVAGRLLGSPQRRAQGPRSASLVRGCVRMRARACVREWVSALTISFRLCWLL